MSDEDDKIVVRIFEKPGKPNWYMRAKQGARRLGDRSTGVPIKPGKKSRDAALGAAAVWQDELRNNRYRRTLRLTWAEFRERFLLEGVAHLRPATIAQYVTTCKLFEELERPNRLADVTTDTVRSFRQKLQAEPQRTQATVKKHLRQLRAVLSWACDEGLLTAMPSFKSRHQESEEVAEKMKGRPLCEEEVDRMIAVAHKQYGEVAGRSWEAVLRWLWISGMRLGEAVNLRWDRQPGGVWVELCGPDSVVWLDAAASKNGKCQAASLTREGVEFLQKLAQSSGYVLTPLRRNGEPETRDRARWGLAISGFGKAAGIITDPVKQRHATAHDLRRGFASRLRRLGAEVGDVQKAMRHASLATTQRYYIGEDAVAVNHRLWSLGGSPMGAPEGVDAPPQPDEAPKTSAFPGSV